MECHPQNKFWLTGNHFQFWNFEFWKCLQKFEVWTFLHSLKSHPVFLDTIVNNVFLAFYIYSFVFFAISNIHGKKCASVICRGFSVLAGQWFSSFQQLLLLFLANSVHFLPVFIKSEFINKVGLTIGETLYLWFSHMSCLFNEGAGNKAYQGCFLCSSSQKYSLANHLPTILGAVWWLKSMVPKNLYTEGSNERILQLYHEDSVF